MQDMTMYDLYMTDPTLEDFTIPYLSDLMQTVATMMETNDRKQAHKPAFIGVNFIVFDKTEFQRRNCTSMRARSITHTGYA